MVVVLSLFGVQMYVLSSYTQLGLAAWSTWPHGCMVLKASTTQSGMTCDLQACWPRCVCCACSSSASADACAGAVQWLVATDLAHLRCTLAVHKSCKQRRRCRVPDDTALIQHFCPRQRPASKQAQATLPHLRFPALQPQTSDTYSLSQAKQNIAHDLLHPTPNTCWAATGRGCLPASGPPRADASPSDPASLTRPPLFFSPFLLANRRPRSAMVRPQSAQAGEGKSWLGPLGAGASAGVAASLVRVPTEVVKQRLQLGGWDPAL